MKQIANWQTATVADLEADGLLDTVTKIHVMSYQLQGKKVSSLDTEDGCKRIRDCFAYHINNSIPMVLHNGICYDIPMVEKVLGIDLSKLMVIDTLALSWYLNFDRNRHGLDYFFEDYGIAKPKIDDWENLSFEEYKNRCQEDVKINKALWEDLKLRLLDIYAKAQTEIDNGHVGGKRLSEDEKIYLDRFVGSSVEDSISRFLSFLMFKMDCVRLQESTGWDVDVGLLDKSIESMSLESESAKKELESVMPTIPKYSARKKPAKPFKKNGELSSSGSSWVELVELFNSKNQDDSGNLVVINIEGSEDLKVLTSYEPPNANSHDQIKKFLFSKGWKPQTFKYERDQESFDRWVSTKPREGASQSSWRDWKNSKPKDREIPQITITGDSGKELCPSLVELAEEVPEINVYAKFTVIKHRLSILKGFKRDIGEDGKLKASINGLTNTLRVCHSQIVNLPGVDKLYGDVVRGVLISGDGYCLCGSDMSSLEDRVKHHFMLPHDPDYVATMQAPDFDPHILMSLFAKMVTQQEFDDFKKGEKSQKVSKARKAGKATNYASVYNAGPPTIARAAGVSLEEGRQLHEGYWKLNWAVKAIAEEQVVIVDSRDKKWLVNPVNGFCYSLRKESDRFSTLAQGTGAFFFDMWLDFTLERQKNMFGRKSLTAQFHDEDIFRIKDTPKFRDCFKVMIKDSIQDVNKTFMLRRELGCETQFGQRYSEIH